MQITESVCAVLGQILLRTLRVQSRHPACPGSDDTRGRGSGKVSALCHAALRKQTDGHAMNQGVSLEQARLWPLPCVFFSFLSLIFFGTLT